MYCSLMFSQIMQNIKNTQNIQNIQASNKQSKKITYGEVFLIIKKSMKSCNLNEASIHKHLMNIYPYYVNTR